MAIKLIAIGKIKERPLQGLCAEYQKRLSRYDRLSIFELPDLPEPKNKSLEEITRQKECSIAFKHIAQSDYVIALSPEGEMQTSHEFALTLKGAKDSGKCVCLIIGGSLGLSQEIYKRADMRLSFSKMTFPHQLFRAILMEQLYRAHKILAKERYHK